MSILPPRGDGLADDSGKTRRPRPGFPWSGPLLLSQPSVGVAGFELMACRRHTETRDDTETRLTSAGMVTRPAATTRRDAQIHERCCMVCCMVPAWHADDTRHPPTRHRPPARHRRGTRPGRQLDGQRSAVSGTGTRYPSTAASSTASPNDGTCTRQRPASSTPDRNLAPLRHSTIR